MISSLSNFLQSLGHCCLIEKTVQEIIVYALEKKKTCLCLWWQYVIIFSKCNSIIQQQYIILKNVYLKKIHQMEPYSSMFWDSNQLGNTSEFVFLFCYILFGVISKFKQFFKTRKLALYLLLEIR